MLFPSFATGLVAMLSFGAIAASAAPAPAAPIVSAGVNVVVNPKEITDLVNKLNTDVTGILTKTTTLAKTGTLNLISGTGILTELTKAITTATTTASGLPATVSSLPATTEAQLTPIVAKTLADINTITTQVKTQVPLLVTATNTLVNSTVTGLLGQLGARVATLLAQLKGTQGGAQSFIQGLIAKLGGTSVVVPVSVAVSAGAKATVSVRL